MKDDTIIQHYGEDHLSHSGSIVHPIYQNALFTFSDWDAIEEAFKDPLHHYIYSRGRNPSADAVEQKIAMLAGGEKAKLCASGMAAISSAVLHFVKSGDHIVSVKNIYGPANNFLNTYLREKHHIETDFVSGSDIHAIADAIQDNTSLIYLESPTSITYELQDLRAVAALAQSKGIHTVIDNTWAALLYQKPLSMGIDLEVHSCSKYIGGHSDVIGGVIIGKEKDLDAIIRMEHAMFGAKIAPFESWLFTRSLRTLSMRMKHHSSSAMKIAQFLESHPKVLRVLYPGLPSFPQYELGRTQMSGYNGLMSFTIDSKALQDTKKFVNSLRMFKIGVSWGGHDSLIYPPIVSYSAELPEDQFRAMGITANMLRISIGLEDVDDLIDDLSRAFAHAL